MRTAARVLIRQLLPRREYAALRGRYWFLRNVWTDTRVVARLFGLASSRSERRSVLRFLVRRLRTSASGADADVELRVGGIAYTMALRANEWYPLLELHADRAYGRDPGFAPRPGWTVLDIGANAGVVTVDAARHGARVVACEPNPACYRRFSRTIEVNGLRDQVTALHCAVGSASGVVRMQVQDGHTERGRVDRVPDATADGAELVPLRTLDEITGDLCIGPVNLLKVDTEGYEVEVLRGAEETLDRVQRVVLEYHSEALRGAAQAILQHHGFPRTLDVSSLDQASGGSSYDGRAGLGVLYASRGGPAPVPQR